MITWMQKHKKWLIVFIWISVISFVGAGFVGWGAYSFGGSGSAVAKVGDTEVELSELQREYNSLFQMYNQMLGGNFDQKQAEEMNLEQQALNKLIQRALILNYAKEMDIVVSDEDVARRIASQEFFHTDGKFDSTVYKRLLQQNNMKPTEYEAAMKKDIAIEKVSSIFRLELEEIEKELIHAAFYMQDRIRFEVLDSDMFSPASSEDEIRTYWEQNQQKYMTDRIFVVTSATVSPSDMQVTEEDLLAEYESNKATYTDKDGKILPYEVAKLLVSQALKSKAAKKEALKRYLKLKKNELQEPVSMRLAEGDTPFDAEFYQTLKSTKLGESLKPVQADGDFITVRLDEVIEPEPKSYEKARDMARVDLLNQKRSAMLKEEAEGKLNTFTGKDIGFIGRDDVAKLEPLTTEEAADFLRHLFESKEARGVYMLETKAVLYEIMEQRLLSEGRDIQNSDFVEGNFLQLKNNLIENGLIQMLQKRYPTDVKI